MRFVLDHSAINNHLVFRSKYINKNHLIFISLKNIANPKHNVIKYYCQFSIIISNFLDTVNATLLRIKLSQKTLI